jgi:hypothetical protein
LLTVMNKLHKSFTHNEIAPERDDAEDGRRGGKVKTRKKLKRNDILVNDVRVVVVKFGESSWHELVCENNRELNGRRGFGELSLIFGEKFKMESLIQML